MSAEGGKQREAMLKELARQLKRYQKTNYQRSITTPYTIPARPFQTSQVDDPELVPVEEFEPNLATNPN